MGLLGWLSGEIGEVGNLNRMMGDQVEFRGGWLSKEMGE